MKIPTFINLNLEPILHYQDVCHLEWSQNNSVVTTILSPPHTIWTHPVVQEDPLDTLVTVGPVVGWTGVQWWRGSTGRRLGRWPRSSTGVVKGGQTS